MILESGRAASTHNRQRRLIRRLVLVQAERAHHVSVSGQNMSGILNAHAFEHLVTNVRGQLSDRPNEPLGRVDDVGERILHRAAAGERQVQRLQSVRALQGLAGEVLHRTVARR